jgi:hypothetical protein
MNQKENSNFKRLIGVWKTEGTIITEKGSVTLTGTDSYEFILEGNYILHKAHVTMGDEKSETLELIGFDNSMHEAKMQYYNSKGESGLMTSSIIENTFIIKGDKLKFEGSINDTNTTVNGTWYMQAEGTQWKGFIELTLTKKN